MAKLRPTSSPPAPKENPDYTDYRSWLLNVFYNQVCAYCHITHRAVEIDHYKPSSGFGNLKNEPSNLVLSCSTCNRSKGDYHPEYLDRTRAGKDTSKFPVLHPFHHDIANFFDIELSGKLKVKRNNQSKHSQKHINLLGLDSDYLVWTQIIWMSPVSLI